MVNLKDSRNAFVCNLLAQYMHQGSLVRLVPIERRHFAKSLEWLKDTTVTEYLPVSETVDIHKEIGSLEHLLKSDFARGFAVETLEGEHIGNGVLHHIDFRNKRAEFSGLLGETSFWGKGYAVEATALVLETAFEKLGLNKVYCRISVDNMRAQEFSKKMGFTQEGVLRQEVLKNEEFVDFGIYSLLAEEYFRLKGTLGSLASGKD